MFLRPLAALCLLLALIPLVGCDAEQALEVLQEASKQRPTPAAIPGTRPPQESDLLPTGTDRSSRPADVLRIASFNIQVFGVSKVGKPEVVRVLHDIVRRFDVVAVQEIRSKDQSVFADFVKGLGGNYQFIVGPRLGRTASKEQYAFIYDASRVTPMDEHVYTIPDRYEDFHREPFVARFQSLVSTSGRPFTFTLINIHTDPDEVEWEVNRLDDVYRAVQRDGSGEDDVILLGDLNASENELGELGSIPQVTALIRGVPTNTRMTKTYDNLLIHQGYTTEFTGRAAVLNFRDEWGLSEEAALDISDHFPVWAEFSVMENAGAMVAEEPGGVLR